MKIESVDLYVAKFKLKQVFTTSLGSRDHNTNIIVKIRSSNGLTGWGECSPNPKINGETSDTCMLIGQLLAKNIIGQDPSQHENIMRIMDQTIYGNSSIKSALDIACFDLAAQNEEKPLYRYLGGSIDKKVFTDYTVSVDSIDQMREDALSIKERGFPAIKIKLGDGKVSDIERVKAIRLAVGEQMDLRADANQGWTVIEAIHILNEMDQFAVQYCEEPINRKHYFELNGIRKKSLTRVMADESLFDHHDAVKLIKGEHCDLFNIKLGKAAGLLNAQKIIKLAEGANLDVQIGCFMESKIGMTANCHLTHTSHAIKYHDFDSPLFHSIDPVEGGIAYQKDWSVTIGDAPGLGLQVDQAFLNQCPSVLVD